MLMFIITLCLIFVIVPFIVQLTFMGIIVTLPIILSVAFIAHHTRKSSFEKIENKLRILTCAEGLKKLSLEERRRLARVVDDYLNDFAKFKQSAKDSLMWAGVDTLQEQWVLIELRVLELDTLCYVNM